jgi:hypothetical protein
MARRAQQLLLFGLLAATAVWAQFYIERTSFVSRGEHVFSLWDDAMISMRYARNLAAGAGLVWNPGGERVQGFSNPGVTLVMAGVHLLPLSPARTSLAMQWLGLALLLGSVLGCGALARRLVPEAPAVAWAALLSAALCAPLAVWTLQGSDVGFVALWLVGGVCLVARSDRRRGAWPGGALWLLAPGLLLRWDVVLLYIVFLAVSLSYPEGRRRRLIAGVAAGAAILGALVAASWLYYGDPLANTFYLKATGTPHARRLESALQQLRQWGWGLLPLLAAAGSAVWERRRDRVVLLCAALVASLATYDAWIGGDWAMEYGSRFLVQGLPLLLVLGVVGLWGLLERLLPGERAAGLRSAACIAGAAWMAVAACPPEARQDWFEPRAETMYWHYNFENHLYASYFRDHTRPATTLGLHSSGVPGYFSERTAVDLLGRSDRHIARMKVDHFEPGHAKWDWDYIVNERRPDIILFASRGLARRADFRAQYLRVTGPGASGWPSGMRREFFLRRSSVGRLLDTGIELQSLAPPGSGSAADDLRSRPIPPSTAAQLGALGYLSGYEPFPERTGVLVHDPSQAFPGTNLYLSGHADAATLMSLDGEILHEWRSDFRQIWPGRRVSASAPTPHWRRVHLYPNGDLLAIYEGLGLVKLDRESRVLWKRAGTHHHDLDVADDGRIHVLTYRRMRHPRFPLPEAPDGRIDVDFVSILDARGRPLREVSILDAFLDSGYAPLMEGVPRVRDIFHTNALKILDGSLEDRNAAFRAGNVLISVRSLDAIAVLDLEREQVVWALTGAWRKQHDPTLLANGNLLLFDNLGHRGGFSRVLEIDPDSREIVWAYEGDETDSFRSELRGASQRLPNGSTLITDSQHGRALEVTPEKQVVWEFVNPARAREHPDRIAVLYALQRLPPGATQGWLGPLEAPVDAR